MNEDLNLASLQAIAKGDREAVLNLLARGVNVNGRVNDGPTPLDMAVVADRPEMARLLVAHGADVNAQRENGWTPLHVAAFEGRCNMVRVLIEEGADVAAATADGLTPSDIAKRAGHGNALLRSSFSPSEKARGASATAKP
jgi:ankyrin repeat protein